MDYANRQRWKRVSIPRLGGRLLALLLLLEVARDDPGFGKQGLAISALVIKINVVEACALGVPSKVSMVDHLIYIIRCVHTSAYDELMRLRRLKMTLVMTGAELRHDLVNCRFAGAH